VANVFCLSSDERALVLGAKQLGFEFHTRLPDRVTITVVCIMVPAVECSAKIQSSLLLVNSVSLTFLSAILALVIFLVFNHYQ